MIFPFNGIAILACRELSNSTLLRLNYISFVYNIQIIIYICYLNMELRSSTVQSIKIFECFSRSGFQMFSF